MRHLKPVFTGIILLASGTCASAAEADAVPDEAIFITSGGYWEGEAGESETQPKGYYKLVAMRQPDRTARVFLQQIAVTDKGLERMESVELEEFATLKPYVTDIRPESSHGASNRPGLFATVFVKTDPAQREADSWTVLIDELGDIRVERASN